MGERKGGKKEGGSKSREGGKNQGGRQRDRRKEEKEERQRDIMMKYLPQNMKIVLLVLQKERRTFESSVIISH